VGRVEPDAKKGKRPERLKGPMTRGLQSFPVSPERIFSKSGGGVRSVAPCSVVASKENKEWKGRTWFYFLERFLPTSLDLQSAKPNPPPDF